MFSPLLKKAEEKTGIKKDEGDSPDRSPPAKRLCTTYAKQLAKMAPGDQGLDLLQVIEIFRDEKCPPEQHPAHCIMDLLASKLDETNALHASQLESWYREYTGIRGVPALFKTEVTLHASEVDMSYRNLQLSYQGAERQAPNNLSLALRFSRIIQIKQEAGEHPAGWTTDERLRDVVNQFHITSGLTAKHRLDEDRIRSIHNLIAGTCAASRQVLVGHLDRHKWRDCAFSSDQLRSARWCIGTSPKMSACPMKRALTVTEDSQVMFLKLVCQSFVDAGRRLRASARAKMRLNADQFDRYCDFNYFSHGIILNVPRDYFAEIEAAISSKLTTWQLQHLSLWSDYIEPPTCPVVVADTEEITAMEDQATAAKFREIKTKLASDCANMTRFNTQVPMDEVQTVVYCDCAKFGVMTQPEVNGVGELLEKVLFRNPFRSAAVILPPLLFGSASGGSLRNDWRRIEDKLVTNHKIELRTFVINLDLSEIHGNRECPMAFVAWLAVPDSTLPNKGTAHRALRGKDVEPPPAQVNALLRLSGCIGGC
eukprot:s5416_g1.t1